MQIEQNIQAIVEAMEEHRRWLHRHPELGFAVYNTRDYILAQLCKLNFDQVVIIAETGIKATIVKNASLKTIAFRADMDALSIKEETGLEFASVNQGVMHACGHDAHMAILLGFAEWLSFYKDNLTFNIVLIFQPAEESVGGALPMIREGVLDDPKVDAIFGLHLLPNIFQGSVGVRSGAVMAQTCEFDIEIMGKSAHGAMPHQGIDALLAAAFFINSIYAITSRKIDPLQKFLLTVGKMAAGERRNVIAERAKIEGIIRTFDDAVYNKIRETIEDVLTGMQKTHGITGSYSETVYYPVVNNDLELTYKLEKLLPINTTVQIEQLMIAEDFSYYQQKVPGVYLFLGTLNEQEGYIAPLHSNRFDFSQEVLVHGFQLYVNIIKNLDL